MMNRKRVLFLCIHNSARSQMAEAFLNEYGSDHFLAESGGIEAGNLNPLAVQAMAERGIDISHYKAKSVFDLHKEGRHYDCVIAVCDEGNAARCPVFPGQHERLHWSLEDPSSFQGSEEERLDFTRKIRDQIKTAVIQFIENTDKNT
ncbi:MAG: arsenate reductase ArsC [Saprospiraceae bacterium]|nr:arsenate reductase ArsC [Candidatus Vicinibacter affinis]